jgi:hypothetical protein
MTEIPSVFEYQEDPDYGQIFKTLKESPKPGTLYVLTCPPRWKPYTG